MFLDVAMHFVDEFIDFVIVGSDLLFVSLQGRLDHLLEETEEFGVDGVFEEGAETGKEVGLVLLLVGGEEGAQNVHTNQIKLLKLNIT